MTKVFSLMLVALAGYACCGSLFAANLDEPKVNKMGSTNNDALVVSRKEGRKIPVLLCESAKTKEKNKSAEVDKSLAAARELLRQGQLEPCELALAKQLLQEPGNLPARKMHADVLYQLGRFHYAAGEASEVLAAKPDDTELLLLMGKISQSIHKPAEAIKFYEQYLAKSPEAADVSQYKLLISVLKDEENYKSNKRSKSRTIAGDYLAAISSGALAKWKNADKIRVFIKDGSSVEGYRPEFEESLRQAFDDWNTLTDGKIGFLFVNDPANAQMTVTWTSDLHAPALKAEAGLAKTTYGADGLGTAEILLLTVDPFKEGPIARNYLYNVCLHEIGHSLGLQGHSPYPDDIMAPSLYVQHGLSDRDINTVLLLYSDDNSVVDKIPEKDEYGRTLSPTVKAQYLANLGSKYTMAGDYEKAIDTLKKSLQLDPKSNLARGNISAAANNLAIADGVSDAKAVELLRLALYWSPDNNAAHSNLASRLKQSGIDPQNFAQRVANADKLLSSGDKIGATVELREALKIKEDPLVRKKLQSISP